MKFLLPLFSLFTVFSTIASADEGMWTFDNFPKKSLEKKYGFDAKDSWLEHVRLSSARLAGGCSASFVSKTGLVLTNHHCAHSCIEQLSTEKKDYVASGFYAKTLNDEVRCPEIEVNRLVEIKDVTATVQKATEGLKGQAYNEAQKAMMSALEKECTGGSDTTRCDVVTLYKGGRYGLYKYQRYQDVRLVFAPEFGIAFFGGDPDNFMFPRYDLDFSFLRVYENGKPLENKEFFKWAAQPAKEGDLTFVTGHPGRTSRLLTVVELEFNRDVRLRQSLLMLAELRGFLTEYQKRGPEQKRTANAKLFGVENSFKALNGQQLALLDKDFFAKKIKEENALRAKINANSAWKKKYASAWDDLAKAHKDLEKIYTRLSTIESTEFGSHLFGIAKTLVRAAGELPKPNGKRYREFAESNLPHIKQDLFSSAPIYDEFEIANLTFALTKARELLTADDPFVKKIFGQKSPAQIAEALVKGTKLRDIKLREALFKGGLAQIEASKDPMIQFALLMDPDTRAVRKNYEDNIESVIKVAAEKVAQAKFAVYGTNTYPDATFTLRVSYGQIKGYEENGKHITPITKMSGAFERHTGQDPYALPESWLKAKSKLNLRTAMNFCSTNDIIGGNSGSPVINKNAELIGLIFDGNIQSLGGAFGFDESVNRAVAVDSSAILEALRNIYGASRLVEEL